jgi:colanic acid/amylovoran biosynthesis glycosyltransferase
MAMRVAFFVSSFPLVSETFILRQITGLLDLGHEVDIIANARPAEGHPVHPEVVKYGLMSRTHYVEMPAESGYWEMPVRPLLGRTWPPGSATPVPNLLRVLRAAPHLLRCLLAAPGLALQVLDRHEYGYQAESLSALYRLARLCGRRRRYDVLHAHFGPVGNSFRFARRLWRAPIVVSFHGYDFCTVPRREGPGVYRRLFDTADAVTANSRYTARRLAELGCPLGKLHTIPVGLHPDQFPFQARTCRAGEPVRVLTVARLVEIKGHEYAIQAFAKAREHHPEIRYDIIGEGPLRPQLEQLIRRLGVEGVATLHGPRDGTAVRRMMAAAHLFVLASVSVQGDQEGQGLALQEAQASGLPVIATQHGAFPEGLVPGRSGFLVPERDVGALAERLTYLVGHPEVWPEMGRQGRRHVEARYDICQLNDQLVRLYERVMADYRRMADEVKS